MKPLVKIKAPKPKHMRVTLTMTGAQAAALYELISLTPTCPLDSVYDTLYGVRSDLPKSDGEWEADSLKWVPRDK